MNLYPESHHMTQEAFQLRWTQNNYSEEVTRRKISRINFSASPESSGAMEPAYLESLFWLLTLQLAVMISIGMDHWDGIED